MMLKYHTSTTSLGFISVVDMLTLSKLEQTDVLAFANVYSDTQ